MPIHATTRGWVLETRSTGYALGLNPAGLLGHRYWGARLPWPEDYPLTPDPRSTHSFVSPSYLTPEEYPGHGGLRFAEPGLKVTFADGTRDLVLGFESAEVLRDRMPELRIALLDARHGLRVTLRYRVHEAHDLIERSAEVRNIGGEPVTLERAWSAVWHLPEGGGYRLTHLAGQWLDEFRVRREVLQEGAKVLESRTLTTGHRHHPWFALDRAGDGGPAGEEAGEVWFGALAWSGNWKLSAEVTEFGSTRVALGLNDWDFAWRLGPGEVFMTPSAYGGYSDEGFGGASRRLHDFVREMVLPHGLAPHKVLYNSWEATLFSVTEAGQAELAGLAAAMGVELFVVDDGWFHGRSSDTAGLGDWWPDERKFPDGLGSLVSRVKALGMDFGLWVEPEMVNPDSDLYRAHPDWVFHFTGRERTEARNQLVLNLAREDVQDHLIGRLDRLLSENEIDFVKWDFNRPISEPGWPGATGEPRELWVRHVGGLYRVWGTLRDRHPRVTWQTCSGGGGRVDLGMLGLADQAWVSDNTSAPARLEIQEGYSFAYPACTMEAWATDADRERVPLEFRFHAAMCGVLGVGGHLARWSEAERAEAARLIALYKEVRPLVQGGDLYRLRSAHAGAFSAVQYVNKSRSEAVLFAFRTHVARPVHALAPLRLRGLDRDALYEVEGAAGARSGEAWLRDGLRLELGEFESTLRRIRRV